MCGKERETMCARMTIAFPARRATQDPLVSSEPTLVGLLTWRQTEFYPSAPNMEGILQSQGYVNGTGTGKGNDFDKHRAMK